MSSFSSSLNPSKIIAFLESSTSFIFITLHPNCHLIPQSTLTLKQLMKIFWLFLVNWLDVSKQTMRNFIDKSVVLVWKYRFAQLRYRVVGGIFFFKFLEWKGRPSSLIEVSRWFCGPVFGYLWFICGYFCCPFVAILWCNSISR